MLRPYQEDAVEAAYEDIRTRDDNPTIVIPTAGGKSHVIARICQDATEKWGGRVVVLAHVRELLEQNAEKIVAADPNLQLKLGVYSAGLKSKDSDLPITVAGIQSAYRSPTAFGKVDLAIVDEAHRIPEDGEGMYRTFLAGLRETNPDIRVIGLTATPYRMKTGMICKPDGILNHICYEIGVSEMIQQGYLCKLTNKSGKETLDTSGLHIRGGEFVPKEAEDLMNQTDRVDAACQEIVEKTRDRKSVLVFCSGIDHAMNVCAKLHHYSGGSSVAEVFGETDPKDRDERIAAFKSGALKYLVNVNVLTTGFNAPNVDCIAMLRPTMSPGLMYQMIGRGFRIHPGKKECLILDFGGNLLRHGPVDMIRIEDRMKAARGEAPWKRCEECGAVCHAATKVCNQCSHEFPARSEIKHDESTSDAAVLCGGVLTAEHEVEHIEYRVHEKEKPDGSISRTLRVSYTIGFYQSQSEWICIEHKGYAYEKARAWWAKRSQAPIPETIEDAIDLAYSGALAETKSITIRTKAGEKYGQIVGHDIGPIPEWDHTRKESNAPRIDWSDVPF